MADRSNRYPEGVSRPSIRPFYADWPIYHGHIVDLGPWDDE